MIDRRQFNTVAVSSLAALGYLKGEAVADTLNNDLIRAAWRNDVEAAGQLIAQGADVNFVDGTVQSAYLIATSEGYLDLLDLTLTNGADVQAKDSYNGTGLIRAAERGHAFVVGALIRAGIEMDHVNNLGWVALHEAIILGDGGQRYIDTVRVLLAAGANAAIASQGDGLSSLELALNNGFDTIAATLRAVTEQEAPADPQAFLWQAASSNEPDNVVRAIRAGADPTILAQDGETPLSIAARPAHQGVTRLLHALIGPA